MERGLYLASPLVGIHKEMMSMATGDCSMKELKSSHSKIIKVDIHNVDDFHKDGDVLSNYA